MEEAPTRKIRKRSFFDWPIVFSAGLLVVLGIVVLASASFNLAKLKFDDSFYFLKHQLIFGLSVGVVGFLVASKVYYRQYEKISIIFLVISIGLLVLVFTPLGITAGGAERWLNVFGFSFQPAEILKLSFVIYLAAWLSERGRERVETFGKGLLPFIILLTLVCGLLLAQPSTSSTVMILGVSLIMYFVSGAKIKYLIGIVLLGMVSLAAIIYFTPYRLERIKTFLNPTVNDQGAAYHINQTLLAIGNGGLKGVGFGKSETKIKHLPEPIGDSIFAVAAEEFGFLGSLTLIGLFFILVARILFLAGRVKDKFGQLMMIGFGSLIAIQAFINIAAISGAIPLTGAPLPFISYGGTALAIFMTMVGVTNNVARYNS